MKTETTTITCDIDGKSPAKGIRFGFSGRAYAIDLCEGCKSTFDTYWRNGSLVKEPFRDRKKSD